MAEEKKGNKIDSKLEASIRKANFTLLVAFVSSTFLTLVSIWFFFEALLISDVELIFKYSTLKFFTIDLSINVFPLVASAFISVIYIVNLILLDKLFSHILSIKGKLDKLEGEFLVKKVYKVFYGADIYKLFVFANFVLIPLISLATIMYKFIALHSIVIVGGTSLLLILSSLGALVFLIRRYEQFDFHEIADHIIGLIFIIFLTIIFIYLYFIFLSFINASNQTLFKWFTFIIIPLPMLIYLFLAAKIFPKNKKALDVTQLFIPVIFIIIAVVVFVVNSVFIFMKNIPQKFSYAYGLIPKIEIKGKDFIKLYLLGFEYYIDKNKPSDNEILNIFVEKYIKAKSQKNYKNLIDELYLETSLVGTSKYMLHEIRICEREGKKSKETPESICKNLKEKKEILKDSIVKFSFTYLFSQALNKTSYEIVEEVKQNIKNGNYEKSLELAKKNIEIYINENYNKLIKKFVSEFYDDVLEEKYVINIYEWLLPVSKPIYYRILVFEEKFKKLLNEGFNPEDTNKNSIIYYSHGENLPPELKEFYYRTLNEGEPLLQPIENNEKSQEIYEYIQNKKFMFINLVSNKIKREYIFLLILKNLIEEKNFIELLSMDKLIEKINYSDDLNTKFEIAKLRIILDTLDFKGRNLRYAHLVNVYSELANFQDTDLRGSNIPLSILNYVNFSRAKLNYADLNASWFFYSLFKDTDLRNANLQGTYISNSLFIKTNLQNANISHSYIENSLFVNADLRKTDLRNTYVMTSIFINPKFDEKTYINETKLSESSLFLVTNPIKARRELKSSRIKFNNLTNWYNNYGKYIIFEYSKYRDRNGKIKTKVVGIKNKIFLLYFIYTLNYIKTHPELSGQRNQYFADKTLGEEATILLKKLRKTIYNLDIPTEEKESIFAIEQGSVPIELVNKETYKAILILLTLILSSASLCYYCKEYIK